MCYALSGTFTTAGIPSYMLIVIVGPYTFENRIHKVAIELPNITEGLVGVQPFTLFLLQISLTDGSVNEYNFS